MAPSTAPRHTSRLDADHLTGDTLVSEGDGSDSDDDAYEAHLARSRAVWDRWSDRYSLSEQDFEPMREAAIDVLNLEKGDRVLDIGCGPGVNFERIRDDIGAGGELVAIDYSPEMVARARQRVTEHGWSNVDVRRGDATSTDLGEGFDAAIATLSLSVMPDIHRAVENIHRSVAPGGRVVVFDLRTVPSGPARVLNPLLRRFFYWFANWNPDGAVIDSLRAVFDEATIVETYAAGIAYTVCATKQSESD